MAWSEPPLRLKPTSEAVRSLASRSISYSPATRGLDICGERREACHKRDDVALRRCLGVVTIVFLALGGVRADAGPRRDPQEQPVDHRAASAALGRIVGAVTDPAGVPLDGAVVFAFGPTGPEMTLADADGRFMLRSLAPGAYLVRAHLPGYAASRRELVEVSARTPTVHAITLSRVGQVAEPIAASVGLRIRADSGAQPAETDEAVFEAAGTETPAPHDHGEKAWRMRRVRRSVLKDAAARVAAAPLPAGESSFDRVAKRTSSLGSPARFARGLLGLPLSGEVNLLTRGTLDAAPDMIAVVPGSAGIANLSVGAPVWHGDLLAQGAMSAGDLTSWVLSGAYLADTATAHRLATAPPPGSHAPPPPRWWRRARTAPHPPRSPGRVR